MTLTPEAPFRTAAPAGSKENWKRVKFGDVAVNVNATEPNPLARGLDRYVGLDHLAPEDLRLKRWGAVADGITFTRVFRAGQVLFGKRRAYQRKVAVAEFDGVCSGDMLVFEAKSNVLVPDLLPFIVQSEGFFQHALGTSAGSLSPRTKWAELAKFGFALPPMDEQKRIAEILWASNSDLQERQEISQAVVALRKTILDRFLSDAEQKAQAGVIGWSRLRCEEVLRSAPRNGLSPLNTTGGVPNASLSIGCIQDDTVTVANHEKIALFDPKQVERFRLQKGDVLAVRGNGNKALTGLVGMVREDLSRFVFPDLLIRMVFDEKRIHPDFAVIQWNSNGAHARLLQRAKSSNGIWKINGQDIRSFELLVPPLKEQIAFLNHVTEIQAVITACDVSLSRSRALRRHLVQSLLGGYERV